MKHLILSSTLAALGLSSTVTASVVLNEKIMKLTKIGAELSALAYEEAPAKTEDMDYLYFFDDEPDQALVVHERDGYCFGAYRGTTLTWDDWCVVATARRSAARLQMPH